ncbi:acyltransferase family protein [Larsenimonas suaedae]|uniref:Acyltransferase n=1 Tax=Larsenimonas suaedae TaxID=1851019 RepID=A0ABU1GWL6_9GAMM|nr:acyltransferase [Larsenimonas suaedae]MCM2973016.1 acyltransferase [Larsenimonas suaedae]MDR5896453.1 acyltransferase [Larsenimonas suaedae]
MTSASPIAKSSKPRYQWMDAMRGLAICLVVYFHGTATLPAKLEDTSPIFEAFALPMQPLRMPLLMFLSGLLLIGSVKKGPRKFFSGKVQHILYPYIVWTLVMVGVYKMREIMLGKDGLDFVHAVLTGGADHLWFLHMLFLFYLAAYFLMHIRPWFGLVLSIALYIPFWLMEYENLRFFHHAIFFMLGGWAGCHIAKTVELLKQLHWSIAGAMFIAGMVFFIDGMYDYEWPDVYFLDFTVAALAIIPGAIKAMMWVSTTRISPPLEWMGKNSLPIYMVHWPLMYASPVFIAKFYSGNPDIMLVFFIAGVLAMCCATAYLSKKFVLVSLLFSSKAWGELYTSIKYSRSGVASTADS